MIKFYAQFCFKKKEEIAENPAFFDEKENSGQKSWNAHFFFVFQPVVRLAERVTAKPTRPQQQPVVAVAK